MANISRLGGLINRDWFAFSVLLAPCAQDAETDAGLEFCFNNPFGCHIVEFSGTNLYRRRLIVYNGDGSKLLTLLCCPHSKIINSRSALVEIANAYLYGSLSWVLDTLYSMHPFAIQSLSRIDVCCDFPCNPERYSLINMLATNRAYIQGKRSGSQFHSYDLSAAMERTPHCMSWGSKNSNMKWKLYNKSLEITEIDKDGRAWCTKPYIRDGWAAAGWDVNNVWRLEISVSPMAKYTFRGRKVSYEDVINDLWLEDFFVSCYHHRFVCRANDGNADHRKDRLLHLLTPLGECDRVRVKPPSSIREVAEYVPTLRAAMAQLEREEVRLNDNLRQCWIDTATATIEVGNLQGYFLSMYGYSYKELGTHYDAPANVSSSKNPPCVQM